jgi:environmental stress-induced protein Ves
MARVASDGPFSAFPGIDRTLTVVSGCGLSLRTAGRDATTLSVGTAPFAFSGDTPTEARLTNGPILDLNVMTRRRLYRHALLPITRSAEHRLPDYRSAAVLISLDGSTHLHGLASGCPVRLDHGDAAVIEAAAATVRVAPGPGALAWLVLLYRAGSQAGCR